MDSAQKLEIIKAVNYGKTNDYEISRIAKIYSLMQLGVTIDWDELSAKDCEMILYLAKEIQWKQERDAKLKSMR